MIALVMDKIARISFILFPNNFLTTLCDATLNQENIKVSYIKK